MKYKVAYVVRKGSNKKKCEDGALIGNIVVNDDSGSVMLYDTCCICLGDGVGGNAGGDFASNYLMKNTLKVVDPSSIESLKQSLLTLNNHLIRYARSIDLPDYRNMASTYTGLFFAETGVYLAHCGNTRIYVQQGNYLKQLTVDQTTYQWLITMENEEGAEKCNRSEIRGAFGAGDKKYAEILVVEEVFKKGIPQLILMTSDGVHDILNIDEIEDIIFRKITSEERVSELVSDAFYKGSKDDCSAILIEILM